MGFGAIHNDDELAVALAQIDALICAQPSQGTAEADRLEVLAILVEAYESKAHVVPDPDDPVAVIEFFLEQKGLTRSDLEGWLGGRSRVADVMNRKRPLSLEMVRVLHAILGIPADLLVGPPAFFQPELRVTVRVRAGERRSLAEVVRTILDRAGVRAAGVRALVVDKERRRIVVEADSVGVLEAAERALVARFPDGEIDHVGYRPLGDSARVAHPNL